MKPGAVHKARFHGVSRTARLSACPEAGAAHAQSGQRWPLHAALPVCGCGKLVKSQRPFSPSVHLEWQDNADIPVSTMLADFGN